MALPSGKLNVTARETIDDNMIRSLGIDYETRLKAGKSKQEEVRWVMRLVIWTQHQDILDLANLNPNVITNSNMSGRFQGGDLVSLNLDETWNDGTGEWELIAESLVSTGAQGSEFVTHEQHWLAVSDWADANYSEED